MLTKRYVTSTSTNFSARGRYVRIGGIWLKLCAVQTGDCKKGVTALHIDVVLMAVALTRNLEVGDQPLACKHERILPRAHHSLCAVQGAKSTFLLPRPWYLPCTFPGVRYEYTYEYLQVW